MKDLEIREYYFTKLKKIYYELAMISNDLIKEHESGDNNYEFEFEINLNEEGRNIEICCNTEGLLEMAMAMLTLATYEKEHSIGFDFDNRDDKGLKISLKKSKNKNTIGYVK